MILSPSQYSGSYPTYEEWKQKKGDYSPFTKLYSSYPTYEEWKHFILFYIFFNYPVLILPMRNGNDDFGYVAGKIHVSFLSYL